MQMWQEKHSPSELNVNPTRSWYTPVVLFGVQVPQTTLREQIQEVSSSIRSVWLGLRQGSARCHRCNALQVPQVRTVEVIKEVKHWRSEAEKKLWPQGTKTCRLPNWKICWNLLNRVNMWPSPEVPRPEVQRVEKQVNMHCHCTILYLFYLFAFHLLFSTDHLKLFSLTFTQFMSSPSYPPISFYLTCRTCFMLQTWTGGGAFRPVPGAPRGSALRGNTWRAHGGAKSTNQFSRNRNEFDKSIRSQNVNVVICILFLEILQL